MRCFAKWIRKCSAALVAAAVFSGLVFAQSGEAQTGIVVNDVELTTETVRALQQIYPVEIAPGITGTTGYRARGDATGNRLPGRCWPVSNWADR